jgi:hypothetical protein
MADLFSEGRLADLLGERLDNLDSVVAEMSASSLKQRKQAVKKALEQVDVSVPEIAREKAAIEVGEGDPIAVRLRIPFTGDAAMFALRPTDYSLAPPQGDVDDDEQALCFDRDFDAGTTSDDIAAWAARIADSVEQYLYWQAADVGMHRITLVSRAEALVEERRDRLAGLGELQAELDDVDQV